MNLRNKYILPGLKLSLVFLVICSLLYPLFIAAIGWLTPGKGMGETLAVNGKVVGYALIGQKFDQDKYFWSRPSAVAYNAAGSAGSNKGPTNPDYLKDVQAHIDTFLVHNPGIKKEDIPAELVTYSASGLDPDLSPAGARITRSATRSGKSLKMSPTFEAIFPSTATIPSSMLQSNRS